MSTVFQQKVWNKCKKIPRGRVSTYSELAKAIGRSSAVRAVGSALNKNPFKQVPCHRVVLSSGKLGGFAHGSKAKEKKLVKEGVKIRNGVIVDFDKKLFKF